MFRRKSSRFGLAATALLILLPVIARAEDFYRNKVLTIVAGFSPGGGYDAYDRILAERLPEHIPGRPTVIVQNMPGAGSLTAVRALDATLPGDGTAMVTFNPGLITQSLVQPTKVNLDFRKFSWIGIFTPDFRVCYGFGANGVKSWGDLMHRKQFVLGTTAKGDGAYIDGAMLRQIFDAPVKQILGFPGSAEQRIAIEQGELDGDCGTFSSIPREWLEDHKAHPFVRFTKEKLPEMPASAVFIGNLAKTNAQRDLLDFLDTENEIGRTVIMSNRVPAARIAIIRDAFDATMKDPAFVAEAKKQGLPISPTDGAEAQKMVEKITSASPRILAQARKIFE